MALTTPPAEELAAVRAALSSPGELRDPFSLARDLCGLVNRFGGSSTDFPNEVQELLILAHAARAAFGSAATIIDGLLRERGLFPYLRTARLGVADQLALEMHRPLDFGEDPTVFHRAQARVYHLLLRGRNVALSAPTSFGKSLIVDAVLAEAAHQRAAVIVPTIALIDETRRRLIRRFKGRYKIVTHPNQDPGERTIFVLTPERVMEEVVGMEDISFFAIDEFYKLDPRLEPDRSEAINEALYRLHKRAAQFYLLGPNINHLPEAFTTRYSCQFERSDFVTVATDVIRIYAEGENRLAELVRILQLRQTPREPTLIYCQSPASARSLVSALTKALNRPPQENLGPAVGWISEHYHPEWGFVRALTSGIGLHHGPMPRALQQFVTRAFNDGLIDVLVCTSTLIEGVNTTAKNVVVYDHRIGDNRQLDYFTFQNIRGRSGRMGHHFLGRVYTFADPPEPAQLHVDVPIATQGETASESLLLQIDPRELSGEAYSRVREFYEDDTGVPVEILRLNRGIAPHAQLRLAQHIREHADDLYAALSWRSALPSPSQIDQACELIWEFLLTSRAPRGARTPRQLAFFVKRLQAQPNVRALIEAEIDNQLTRNPEPSPDEAVETVLDFLRNWANYHFPRYLMALSRIQAIVYMDLDLQPGDYSAFAARVENYFAPPGLAALEEYGIPLQIGRKLEAQLSDVSSVDSAITSLRNADLSAADLTDFELELVRDAMQYL